MGERTINGKTLSEITELFKTEIPKTEENWGGKDNNGRWTAQWIKGETYEKLFNEIVGQLNYSREPSEIKMVKTEDKAFATVHMKVTIFDDGGNVVCTKGANGSSEIGNGDLKSNYAAAETEAFKHLCQDMGMGAGQQEFVSRKEKINGRGNAMKERQTCNPKALKQSGPLPERGSDVELTFYEPFGNGQRYRTAKAVDSDGREVDVKLFSDKHQLIEEASGQSIVSFFAKVRKGFVLRCKGEYRHTSNGLEFCFWGL